MDLVPDHAEAGEGAAEVLEPGMPACERRRHPRRSGVWAAQLETARGGRHDCLVLDLSATGAKVRIEQPAASGEVVTLVAARFGTHRCRIVWSADQRVGLRFMTDRDDKADIAANLPDPKFLRGRAEILRRTARSAPGRDAAAGLLRLAQSLEGEAAEIEKQLVASLSIRRS